MKRKREKGLHLSDNAVGFILVIPALAIFCTIILYPFINSILMSFTDKSLVNPDYQIVGLQNYISTFKDPTFLQILKNTVVFVVCSTILPFVLGFIWSIILSLKFKLSGFLRGATLINWIIPGVSISFLWSFIFDANHGVLNILLKSAGIISQDINWLGQGSTAMIAIILARTWQMLPWYMAFLTGGLMGVSKDQVEAARIDGCNNLKVFRYVIIPQMKPIMTIVLILGVIGNLQHFDIPQVMTSGGPAGATTLLSTAVYRQAFSGYNIGMAATMGTVWAILLAGFSFFYTRNAGKNGGN